MKMTVKGAKRVTLALDKLGAQAGRIARGAVYDGARVAADELRRQVLRLPQEHQRFLREGEKLRSLSPTNRESLSAGMGIARFRGTGYSVETAIGFTGYGPMSTATKTYPRGTPNALIARSVEKGSVVRERSAFASAAAAQAAPHASAAMRRRIAKEVRRLV